MEDLNNTTELEQTAPEAPKPKVQKISLAELRAISNEMHSNENKAREEQKKAEAERKKKEAEEKKAKDAEFEKEIDDFFTSLAALSQEDRADFFKLLEEDIKNGGEK